MRVPTKSGQNYRADLCKAINAEWDKNVWRSSAIWNRPIRTTATHTHRCNPHASLPPIGTAATLTHLASNTRPYQRHTAMPATPRRCQQAVGMPATRGNAIRMRIGVKLRKSEVCLLVVQQSLELSQNEDHGWIQRVE
jgi:hypothetical protein